MLDSQRVVPDERPSLRITARFANARLYQFIIDQDDRPESMKRRYPPVSYVCRKLGLPMMRVLQLLNLRLSPLVRSRDGRASAVRPLCQQIADLSSQDVRDLFPEHLYKVRWPSLVVEVNGERFVPLLEAPRAVFALPPNQEVELAEREREESLVQVLETLTPREERVIKMRFGIGQDRQYTCAEVGEYLGVGRARVQQIQAGAIRKLRHPSRSRKLAAAFRGM
jgi:RNA polymerase sigma factor (sigma-70 family)